MSRYRISGTAIAALGLGVFFLAPYQVESVESSAFPRIISVCLVLFGILVVLTSGKQEKQDGVRLLDPLLSSYFILVLAAIVLIRFIGFYPSILLSLPVSLFLLGERKYKKILLFTIMTTGVIYLIIDILLGGRLP